MDSMEEIVETVHTELSKEIELVRCDLRRLPALEKNVDSILGKLNQLLPDRDVSARTSIDRLPDPQVSGDDPGQSSIGVWEESSGESLLQIQLLIALKNFVVALGYHSPSCYNMLLSILQKGIDINNPDELNLLEDSMLLWEATLCHAPSMVGAVHVGLMTIWNVIGIGIAFSLF
ncbi:hypothetical protein PanWU01x14_217800 [Parasponia andersonii]|uniref:Importin-7/11-like TPR repeats domain-containing protein n=1 Tax=Parasponia andersonii TaxID=3476 RepID=A0A2P5BQY4_PARAD|nr:hypothetical protein PanWU01x14_217800 [Parasponia andersonii]